MKVEWTKDANKQLDLVAEYIRNEFGARRRKQFLTEVRQMSQKLRRNPNIGQIDPLFINHAKTYRSVIVNGLNKIVYRIDDDIIYIVAFWDTRMEPENQAAKVK